MVTIYTVTFNEELMLPYFIRHYRSRFPDCRIIVYDNQSTDATVRIALTSGCEVISYDTNNQLDDLKYLEIKNHCWQGHNFYADKGWIFIVDCDELCEITSKQLMQESENGATIIRFQGYNMVNLQTNLDIQNITHGIKDDNYSKNYCFNTQAIKEINYTPGCHVSNPVGEVIYSEHVYSCYHYKYINALYMRNRYKRNAQRMTAHGKQKGMGSHYHRSAEQITSEFLQMQKQAEPLREPMPHDTVKIFISAFQDIHFSRIPDDLHLVKVNLSSLELGALQDNRLSEHRLFLSHLPQTTNCDYTGNLTWRWFQKCKFMLPLEQFWQLSFEPNVVWAAWPDKNWYRQSCIDHKGLQRYLDELIEFTGLSSEGTGLHANQFICSKAVYMDFQAFFRKCFEHFHSKYGFNYSFYVKEKDLNRVPAVFYERIAALYFANRHDLIIKQIPNR